jgi:hypothetical protein
MESLEMTLLPETRRIAATLTRRERITVTAAIAVGFGVGAVAFSYLPPAPPWKTVQWHVPVPSFIPPAPATQPEFEPHHRWYP